MTHSEKHGSYMEPSQVAEQRSPPENIRKRGMLVSLISLVLIIAVVKGGIVRNFLIKFQNKY